MALQHWDVDVLVLGALAGELIAEVVAFLCLWETPQLENGERLLQMQCLQRWLKTCTWSIHADDAFAEVVRACAQPRHRGDGTWITAEMFSAYCHLHELGHAHSLEVRDRGELVGGIYGVAIGRMFFGESMFSRRDHASKLALLALCRGLATVGFPLLDAQVSSNHLRSLGGHELPRNAFCAQVADLAQRPPWRGNWAGHFNAIKPLDLIPERNDGASDSPATG